jgi:hypothetical protein
VKAEEESAAGVHRLAALSRFVLSSRRIEATEPALATRADSTTTMAASALHRPRTRSELLATARREARLARGRDAFVWRGRVLPIGVPVGVALGALAAKDVRRPARAALLFGGTVVAALGVTYAVAMLEWDHIVEAVRG